MDIPSRELTYPTWGKVDSKDLKVPLGEDMLVPRRLLDVAI